MSLSLGAAIYIALKPIFKIYTIMLVGYLVAKFDIVSMENAKGISNMVVNAILPCLTFNKIVSNISWRDIKEIGVIILSAFIYYICYDCAQKILLGAHICGFLSKYIRFTYCLYSEHG